MAKQPGEGFPYEALESRNVFEDKWCKIRQNELVIKTFYFPTGQNKRIDLNSIRGLYYMEQNMRDQCFKVKGWGMSCSPCWWACDLRRNWHGDEMVYYNVVIDCGEALMKGFTVFEISAFLSAIRPLVHPDTIIRHEFPF